MPNFQVEQMGCVIHRYDTKGVRGTKFSTALRAMDALLRIFSPLWCSIDNQGTVDDDRAEDHLRAALGLPEWIR